MDEIEGNESYKAFSTKFIRAWPGIDRQAARGAEGGVTGFAKLREIKERWMNSSATAE